MANPIDYWGDITLHGGAIKDVTLEVVSSFPATPKEAQIVVKDGIVYIWHNTEWVALGSSNDVSALNARITAIEGDVDTLEAFKTSAEADIDALESEKVDKTAIVTSISGTSDTNIPSEKAVKTAIDNAVAGIYHFAGTVATFSALPTGASNGDVYNVAEAHEFEGATYEAGTNWVWDATGDGRWEPLTGIVDVSGFQTIANLATAVGGGETAKYPSVKAVDDALALKADSATVTTSLASKVDKLATKPTAGTYAKVTINAEGQVTAGQAKIAVADISDLTTANFDIVGKAGSATKLASSKNFSITGGATASAVAFNGTDNVALNVTALDGTKVTGEIPVASVPALTSAKITDFVAKTKEVVGAQFKEVALSTATVAGNKYTLTTAGKAYGVMVMHEGAQVFVSTTIGATSIVLDFNSAITASEFTVSYIEKF